MSQARRLAHAAKRFPPSHARGQSSIEALLSIAFLLSAFALLIASAQGIGSRLHSSSQESSERYLLSHEALSIEAAAGLPGTAASRQFRGLPSEKENSLRSRATGVSQPLFHRVSSDSEGNFYVVHDCCEPV